MLLRIPFAKFNGNNNNSYVFQNALHTYCAVTQSYTHSYDTHTHMTDGHASAHAFNHHRGMFVTGEPWDERMNGMRTIDTAVNRYVSQGVVRVSHRKCAWDSGGKPVGAAVVCFYCCSVVLLVVLVKPFFVECH